MYSTAGETTLLNLVIISIGNQVTQSLDYDEIVDERAKIIYLFYTPLVFV